MILKILHLTEEKIYLNLNKFYLLKIGKGVYKKNIKEAEVKVDNKIKNNFLTENFYKVVSLRLIKI